MQKPGYLVISLDFELMWGMFDKVTTESYGDNILGVHTAIPELLALFKRYEIHATWATVGMLMAEHKAELASFLPPASERPLYANAALSSYRYVDERVSDAADTRYHFAPELVRLILSTPNQELASHTFSHYYCLDGGENGAAIFAADCRAQAAIMAKFGERPTSIVFPRNQTTPEALKVCLEAGLTCYRGTESHFLYRARKEAAQTNPLIRALRLMDHYVNLSGHHTYTPPNHTINRMTDEGLVNVRASRFLRPFIPALKFFEPLRLRRIKNAMTHAAQNGEVFHLWWHPHNFGINRKENFTNLIALFEHYQYLQKTYGMQSQTMHELATRETE